VIYDGTNHNHNSCVNYSDVAWIPYENTTADMRNFGWVFQNNDATKIIEVVKTLKNDKIDLKKRLDVLKELRQSHYTYAGVGNQIWSYLKYGESGSDLRCHGYPKRG
jgi:hypothetical protein